MQYLTVSSDQADAITRLNSNNQQSTTDRQQNISQLQAQITHETAKDTLDPMALGTLYAQVESIKREITKDMATLRNNARAVLTDMQRGKLTSLDDARKLQLLICQAGSENLLVPQPSLPLAITGLSSILIGSPVTSFCGYTGYAFYPNP
jgi:hypothetical protein